MDLMNFNGLIIGLTTFFIIGIFHPIVVKAEYYWGKECWWFFLLSGLAGIAGSVFIADIVWSAVCGVFGFSSFWSIKELYEQEERIRKGWFPRNPKRVYPWDKEDKKG